MRVGRPTNVQARQRERKILQLVAAGHGWRDAARLADATPDAALRLIDRIGVGLPANVQLDGRS